MVTNRPEHRGQEQSQRGGPAGAHEFGGRIGSHLRDTGRSVVGQQKKRAGDELESISEAVHEAADQLHERNDHMVAQYIDSFAEQIERAANYVRRTEPSEMIETVSNFARRRPEVVIGGALLLGFIGARFIKASSTSRRQDASGMQHSSGLQHAQPQRSEPFRSGVSQPGGGFETRTSEAGPIATTPPAAPAHTPGSPTSPVSPTNTPGSTPKSVPGSGATSGPGRDRPGQHDEQPKSNNPFGTQSSPEDQS